MSLLDQVRRTIRDHRLALPDTRVVVALSGGPDSVALAHVVRELDAAGELRAAGAAHFNHQLRATADRDERFCAGLAESFGWPIVTDREDVAARARRERRSLEDAARTARHEFLERARTGLGADAVAVGHTRDDQAETFLLRLVRGAGARGLAAMHPRNGPIVRPLLDCPRSAVRAFLDERQIPHVEDESNQDVAILRNRVRAELVPLLEVRFNPAIVDVLAGEAEIARDEWTWMQGAADELVRAALVRSDAERSHAEFDVATLLAAPLALRRLVVWRAMTDAAGGRPVAFEHVRAALRLLEPDAGSSGIDAPGHRAERIGLRLVLTSKPAGAVGRWSPSSTTRTTRAGQTNPANPGHPANLFRYLLSIPGEVQLSEAGCIVSAESRPSASATEMMPAADGAVAIVRSDVCQGPLAVRNRRPGDRFHPVGLGGQKKLQDYFVDRKVARQQRDVVPLVVDNQDRIVWVAGYGIDAEFRVTDPTQAVLILRLKQV
jgi:tRNA(Ile)-lysidine synthase